MAKLSEKALRKRDAARDIGAELLASVREMKAGQAGACAPRSSLRDNRSAHTDWPLAETICRSARRFNTNAARVGAR
jgi:hypothetical protein